MLTSPDTTGATSVVVAHGDPAVRTALRDLTAQGLGMRVVGQAGDPVALLMQVEAERPDLAVVAWSLLAPDAAAALGALHAQPGETRVVVLGPRPDVRRAALDAGADAYISMVDAPGVVAAVLKSCMRPASPAGHETRRRRAEASDETRKPGGLS